MRKENRDFGKLIDGQLQYAPMPLKINGVSVYTNVRNTYFKEGYSAIVRTEMPSKEGYYYTSSWQQTDSRTITEVWEEHSEVTNYE